MKQKKEKNPKHKKPTYTHTRLNCSVFLYKRSVVEEREDFCPQQQPFLLPIPLEGKGRDELTAV